MVTREDVLTYKHMPGKASNAHSIVGLTEMSSSVQSPPLLFMAFHSV